MSDEQQEGFRPDSHTQGSENKGNQLINNQTLENLAAFLSRETDDNRNEDNSANKRDSEPLRRYSSQISLNL